MAETLPEDDELVATKAGAKALKLDLAPNGSRSRASNRVSLKRNAITGYRE